MKTRLVFQAAACISIAFMCSSCMSSRPQQRDNVTGIIRNMMTEPSASDSVDAQSGKPKSIFSWLGGRRGGKRAHANSRSGYPAEAASYQQNADYTTATVSAQEGTYPPSHVMMTDHSSAFAPTTADGMASVNYGDQLVALFFKKPATEGSTYKIGCMDRLTVIIESQNTLEQEVVVRMDGRISFFSTDDLYVKGRTILEIRELIKANISTVTPSAEVTVFLTEGNALAEDFLAQSKSQEQNEYNTVTVRQDGMVSLPLIGEIQAAGLTLPEIRETAQSKYDDLLNNGVSIYLNPLTRRGNTAILGEVGHPGLYPLYKTEHPLYGLALAGGKRETANLKKVVILKRQPDGSRTRHFVNLKDGKAIGRSPVMLDPEDIVIVPKTGIANVNKWVDQYIRRLLPLPTSAGISATYSID